MGDLIKFISFGELLFFQYIFASAPIFPAMRRYAFESTFYVNHIIIDYKKKVQMQLLIFL